MRRVVLAALAAYLALGLVFAVAVRPQQLWTCPDASQPHGTITYGGLDEPPADDCRPSETTTDRLRYFAVMPLVWLPLAVAKGLSDD